jgi:hypothetical protein
MLEKALPLALDSTLSLKKPKFLSEPISGLDEEVRHIMLVKIELAEIQSFIYKEIYSIVTPKSREQLHESVTGIHRRLQTCWSKLKVDVQQVDNSNWAMSRTDAELTFTFISVQLLLVWPLKGQSASIVQSKLASHRCIKLLLRLWSLMSEQGQHVALSK